MPPKDFLVSWDSFDDETQADTSAPGISEYVQTIKKISMDEEILFDENCDNKPLTQFWMQVHRSRSPSLLTETDLHMFTRLASSDDFEKSRAKTSPLQIDLSTPQGSFSAANPNRTSKRRQTTVYRKKMSTKDRNEIFTAWNPLKDGDIRPSELLKMCAKVYGPRGSIYRTVC